MKRGKGWATAGFLLGIATSVAGNVAHARPTLGAQLAAAFYPVALLVTVEVLARVQWPAGRGWLGVRWGGAGLVALVAAIVSYLHLHGLLLSYGEQPVTATIGPLSVDGLMVVSGFALIAVGAVRPAEAPDEVPASEPVVAAETTPKPVQARKPAPRKPVPSRAEGPRVDRDLEPLVERARAEFAGLLAEGNVPKIDTLKTTLRVGHPKAKAVHELLSKAA